MNYFVGNYPQIELARDNINANNVLKCSVCYLDIFSFWLVCVANEEYTIFCSDCAFVSSSETPKRQEVCQKARGLLQIP